MLLIVVLYFFFSFFLNKPKSNILTIKSISYSIRYIGEKHQNLTNDNQASQNEKDYKRVVSQYSNKRKD